VDTIIVVADMAQQLHAARAFVLGSNALGPLAVHTPKNPSNLFCIGDNSLNGVGGVAPKDTRGIRESLGGGMRPSTLIGFSRRASPHEHMARGQRARRSYSQPPLVKRHCRRHA